MRTPADRVEFNQCDDMWSNCRSAPVESISFRFYARCKRMEPFHIFFRGASPFASVNKPLSSWILRWPLRRSRSPKLSNLRTRTSRIRTPHASRPFIRHFSQKYARSSESTSTPHHGNSEPQSLSARWKKLSREYGYTVIGVYLALTVADFPFCFLAVKYIGEERVSHAEHVVVGGVKRGIQRVFPGLFQERGSEKAQPEGNGAEKSTAESESGASMYL